MNTTGEELKKQLEKVLTDRPWYGSSAKTGLSSVNGAVITKKTGPEHSIAEILLHMTGWTEEVTERLNGSDARDPGRGDWPDPAGMLWQDLVAGFNDANNRLLITIEKLPENNWNIKVPDLRQDEEPVSSYKETVIGLIQHHVYHLGQISILNKQFTG